MSSDGTSDTIETRRGRKVLGDSALAVLERIVSQAAQFTIFDVAARTLGPADFGVFALVSACAIILLRAAEVGWAPFIMAWSGDETVPRQVLSVAILGGACFGLLGLAGSLAAGWLGASAEMVTLMMLFSAWVVLANVTSARKGMMVWKGRLQTSVLCDSAGEIAGLLVAVGALLDGHGVLSLVWGRLAMCVTQLALGFALVGMWPRMGIRRPLVRELWVFSAQLFVSRMLISVRLYIATFIIGGYLGPAAVGYYRAAERLIGAANDVIAIPGQMLAWSHFRRARDIGGPEGRTERINRQVRRHIKILVATGAPVLFWLIVQSDEIIRGILGDEWLAAAPLVAILALGPLFMLCGIVTEPLMSITGETRRLPAYTAGIFAASLIVTFVAAHFGLYAVSIAQALIGFGTLVAALWLFNRFAGLDWRAVLADLRPTIAPLAIGVGALVAMDRATDGWSVPPLVEAVLFALLAIPVYALATALLDRTFWRDLGRVLAAKEPA